MMVVVQVMSCASTWLPQRQNTALRTRSAKPCAVFVLGTCSLTHAADLSRRMVKNSRPFGAGRPRGELRLTAHAGIGPDSAGELKSADSPRMRLIAALQSRAM